MSFNKLMILGLFGIFIGMFHITSEHIIWS
jgi:hypothetical protein